MLAIERPTRGREAARSALDRYTLADVAGPESRALRRRLGILRLTRDAGDRAG